MAVVVDGVDPDIYVGSTPIREVYRGGDRLWARGEWLNDPLQNANAWSMSQSSGGGVIIDGEARIAADGTGYAHFVTPAMTDDQYVACRVGGYTHNARQSALFSHDDGSRSGHYMAVFTTGRLDFIRASGWASQTAAFASWSGTIRSDDWIEMWNVGARFRVAVRGSVVIDHVVSNPALGGRRQGIVLTRSLFASSSRMAEWRGGDTRRWRK
ncbi:virion structural protein [Gordonia phage Splinter]|uniref:Uncharacterized protein n=2 Tax=Vendettavirus vendetta TaxID=2049886 RepID=A0A160DCW7_9CAUD|nr:virion structural protein [Gordonia phage Vendetta]YP_009275383.1 virion structural protein [Gordonia phage Splinter]ANA85576.1 hypothetical protein PBI_VENDETTA_28 [Gordonia phage Vendetta]ANA85655.1 hypothetical protein PBI_SPLINTER_28 [Gordonia phage Splinter]